eukprot:350747-Chlamydomonas_euryale.AAC.8
MRGVLVRVVAARHGSAARLDRRQHHLRSGRNGAQAFGWLLAGWVRLAAGGVGGADGNGRAEAVEPGLRWGHP